MRIQFQTGRGYQPTTHKYPGQVIRAILDTKEKRVLFLDLSRGVDGQFPVAMPKMLETEYSLKTSVMNHYDHNDYSYISHDERMRLCGWTVGERIRVKANAVLGTDEAWGTIREVHPNHYVVHVDGDDPAWSGPVSFEGEVMTDQP